MDALITLWLYVYKWSSIVRAHVYVCVCACAHMCAHVYMHMCVLVGGWVQGVGVFKILVLLNLTKVLS